MSRERRRDMIHTLTKCHTTQTLKKRSLAICNNMDGPGGNYAT